MSTYLDVLQATQTFLQNLIAASSQTDLSPDLVRRLTAVNQSLSAAGVIAPQEAWHGLTLTAPTSSSNGTFKFTVPANKRWQFICGYATVTTSATAGNRTCRFGANTGSGQWLQLLTAPVSQAASLTCYYNFGLAPTASAFTTDGILQLFVPPIIVDAGESLVVNLNGYQTGDSATFSLKVVEWSV